MSVDRHGWNCTLTGAQRQISIGGKSGFLCYVILSCRCKELPKGGFGQHHLCSCRGKIFILTVSICSLVVFIQLCIYSLIWSSFRSSQSLRTWSLGFCLKSLSQLRMKCVVSCSVCPPSVKMEPCRYAVTQKTHI